MTIYEFVRMCCYTVGAPTLLYLALYAARQRLYAQMTFYTSLSLLFVWYMVEITIATTGINTREYRIIGTPMAIATTISAAWMAINAARSRGFSWHSARRT